MIERWRERAACKGMNTGHFFQVTKTQEEVQAKRVCEACPVKEECRDYADKHHALGIWGGMSEGERRKRRRALRKKKV